MIRWKPRCYKLVGKTPVVASGPEEGFMQRMEAGPDNDPWRVDVTQIKGGCVSTVFLGLDHNYFRDGPPILFETCVFRRGEVVETERCSTWEEAEAMHARYVKHSSHLRVVK